jgi:hypothetical protein|nr:MAG TPA: hypothetical protein [Caudoviricetes sp.]
MLKEIYAKVASEMGIDPDVVKAAYLSQWQFIRNNIEILPLKGELSEEEFNKLRTNFNLPSLGKLYTTFDKVQKVRRRVEYLTELMKDVKS